MFLCLFLLDLFLLFSYFINLLFMYDWFGLYLQSYINGKAALTSPASVSSAFSDFILWRTTFAKVTNKQNMLFFLSLFFFSFFFLFFFFSFCSSTSNCLRISYTRDQKYMLSTFFLSSLQGLGIQSGVPA